MVEIKIIIPDDKIDELKLGFLKAIKRPDQPEYQAMTDIQFFKRWIKDNITNAYKTGKMLIARETTKPEIDNDVLEDVE